MTINKDIYCGNCRGSGREKSNGVLNHVFIKYVIDQTKFLREGIEVKNKIIDHLFTLKSSLRDEQNFSCKMFKLKAALTKLTTKLYSTATAHRRGSGIPTLENGLRRHKTELSQIVTS